MLSNLMLIVADKEKAEVYYRKLQQDQHLTIYFAETKEEATEKIAAFEPDLILLSNSFNDYNSYELCKQFREIECITRPVIVMIADEEEDASKRIKAFVQGADDYLYSHIEDEEFSVRVLAHIRRHIEELSDYSTRLPGATLINTQIKRRINLGNPWSVMTMKLNNIKPYMDTYGCLAGNQLLKAFMAIVKACAEKEDFFGCVANEEYILITRPLMVEAMAESICATFDQIIPRFYAPYEAERGFTIVSEEGKASRKVNLISISIGVVSSEHRRIDDYKTALSFANAMKDLAKHQVGSGWLVDRPMISGDELYDDTDRQKYILVIESDAALAYLLNTTLEMQGYLVDATSCKQEAIAYIDKKIPDLVLIDAVLPGDDGWGICDYIRTNDLLNKTKIVMATVLHDKEKAFIAGADLYIPKPYELMALHRWIEKLINDTYY
ncbi:MAG: response regulator [Cyanobacteriota bacterium]